MSLIKRINQDVQRITTNSGEFGCEINLTTPDGSIKVDVVGLHSKHNISLDEDGRQVNSKNADIAISEQALVDLEYPVRDLKQEVNLKNHLVVVADSSGIKKNYIIRENFPDETIGLIVCILGDYKE